MPSEASAATQTRIGPQEKPTLILVDNQTPIQDDFFYKKIFIFGPYN